MRDEALKFLAVTCLDLRPQFDQVAVGQVGRLLVDPEASACPEAHVEVSSLLPGTRQGEPRTVIVLLVRLGRFELREQRVELIEAVDAVLLNRGCRC